MYIISKNGNNIYREKVHRTFLVTIEKWTHLFPYRTQQLSTYSPKILGGYPPGKLGCCQNLYSSLAQLVERSAVNR